MRKHLLFLAVLFSLSVKAFDNPPLGARSLGMAGCGTAIRNDIWSAQNNQAGLAWLKEFHIGAFYESRFLVPDLGMKGIALAIPTKAGVFGLDVTSLGLGNLYSENKAGVCFAKPFGDKISASVQIDGLYTHIAENYGSSFVACGEVGIMAEPVKDLTIGFHLFNPTRSKLASGMNERIPTIIRLGATYRFSDVVFTTIEAEKDVDYKPIIRGGIEYKPKDIFYLRVGAAANPGIVSFGFGVKLKAITVDVAASWHSQLGFSPAMGLTY